MATTMEAATGRRFSGPVGRSQAGIQSESTACLAAPRNPHVGVLQVLLVRPWRHCAPWISKDRVASVKQAGREDRQGRFRAYEGTFHAPEAFLLRCPLRFVGVGGGTRT